MADVIETETQGGQRGNKIGISKQLMKNEDKSEKTKKNSNNSSRSMTW